MVSLPNQRWHTILACGVLHNIALRHGIEMDAEIRMDPQQLPDPWPNGASAPADAVRRRRQLIQRLLVRDRMPDNIQSIGLYIHLVESVQQLHYVNKSKPCAFVWVQSQSAQPMCSTHSEFAGPRWLTRPLDVDADGDGPLTPVAKPSPSLMAPADSGASRTLFLGGGHTGCNRFPSFYVNKRMYVYTYLAHKADSDMVISTDWWTNWPIDIAILNCCNLGQHNIHIYFDYFCVT